MRHLQLVVGVLAPYDQLKLINEGLGRHHTVLLLGQGIVHQFVLEMVLKHFLVVLLQSRVNHVGKHVLLDQLDLLLSWLLLLQRLKLLTDFILGPLNERVPEHFPLLKFSLVSRKEVVKELNLDHVFFRYHILVSLGFEMVLSVLVFLGGSHLLLPGTLLQVGILDGDE